tara:strand:+ start:98 stop:277 length:180 start_codon:yes stop_codon:yes gene_type:complete
MIATADGPLSHGQCQHCGEEREFKNFVGGMDWSLDSAAANREQQRQRRLKAFDVTKKGE